MMATPSRWECVAVDGRLDEVPEAVRKFAPKERQREQREQRQQNEPREPADPTDAAGQALLAMLQQAARGADEDLQSAMSLADRLAGELRAVEDRMAQLQATVEHYKTRAQQAEQWLQQIQREIEQKLIAPQAASRGGPTH
jgi:DNA repair ATPase RecN